MTLNEIAFAIKQIKKNMANPDLPIKEINLETKTITFSGNAEPIYSLRTWERIG